MKPAVRQKALEFISKYPGTRNKAFPWGNAFHFTAPGVKRMPFRLTTMYQLIAEGYVTKAGPVKLTAKGEHELHMPLNKSSVVKGRVIYSLVTASGRQGFSLQVHRLNENGFEVHEPTTYPSSADVVAHIRNMPKTGRQRVFRELIHDLAEESTRIANESAAKRAPPATELADLDIRRRELRHLLARMVRYISKDRAKHSHGEGLKKLTEQAADYLNRTADPRDLLRMSQPSQAAEAASERAFNGPTRYDSDGK